MPETRGQKAMQQNNAGAGDVYELNMLKNDGAGVSRVVTPSKMTQDNDNMIDNGSRYEDNLENANDLVEIMRLQRQIELRRARLDLNRDCNSVDARSGVEVQNVPSYHESIGMPDVPPNQNLNVATSRCFEPKVSLPKFNGKEEWESFWVPFEFLAVKYNWNPKKQLEYLITSVEGEALKFVSHLPCAKRDDIYCLVSELKHRFGDNVLPETYRVMLQSVKKNSKQSLHEYAATVENMVSKAYPGMQNEELYATLCVEHFINGLTDPNIVYDVLTKRPQRLEEAIDLVMLHEGCKSMSRHKMHVRKIECQKYDEDDFKGDEDNEKCEVRRVNGKRFVTEERLQQFGRELKEDIVTLVTDSVVTQLSSKFQTESEKSGNNVRARDNDRGYTKPKFERNIKCYACHKMGHYANECNSGNNRRKDKYANMRMDREERSLDKTDETVQEN